MSDFEMISLYIMILSLAIAAFKLGRSFGKRK